jgi:hypothetical protein
LRGQSPLSKISSPSPLKERGTEGVRMIKNFKEVTNGKDMEADNGGYLDYN